MKSRRPKLKIEDGRRIGPRAILNLLSRSSLFLEEGRHVFFTQGSFKGAADHPVFFAFGSGMDHANLHGPRGSTRGVDELNLERRAGFTMPVGRQADSTRRNVENAGLNFVARVDQQGRMSRPLSFAAEANPRPFLIRGKGRLLDLNGDQVFLAQCLLKRAA